MKYKNLSTYSYGDKERYDREYKERFNDEYAVHINFDLNGKQAFFTPTIEAYKMLADIQRLCNTANSVSNMLPPAAVEQFGRASLIEEIDMTNQIEGVRSSKEEVRESLSAVENDKKADRFDGLIRKYIALRRRDKIALNTCRDLRTIYDELVSEEVSDKPDGQIFRKGEVHIFDGANNIIHNGVMPESAIIDGVERALAFLWSDDVEPLFRAAAFHFLLEYIHPFYDGNGRLGRFICSYIIRRELGPLLAFRFSMTMKEHINEYYKAFEVCEDARNCGDLTPFILMFLSVVKESCEKTITIMKGKEHALEAYERHMEIVLPPLNNQSKEVFYVILQATMFGSDGISAGSLASYVEVSRPTLRKMVEKLPSSLLLRKTVGHKLHYMIDLEAFEDM